MEEYEIRFKKSVKFRTLSIQGDKTNIGLELVMEGKINKELLSNGIDFCNSIINGLEKDKNLFIYQNKSSILRNKRFLNILSESGINVENIRERVEDIKINIYNLLNNIILDKNKIIELQKQVQSLSIVFYLADVKLLQWLKKSKFYSFI